MTYSKLSLKILLSLTLIQLAFIASAEAGSSKSKKKVVAISFQAEPKTKSKIKKNNKAANKSEKEPSQKKTNVVTYHYSQRTADDVQIEPLTKDAKISSNLGLKKIAKKKSKKKRNEKSRAIASAERGPDNVNQVGNAMPEKIPVDLPAKKEFNRKELQSFLKNMRGADEDNLDSEIEGSL